jgi:glycosyltransferase involved in cell wall biosynthesis
MKIMLVTRVYPTHRPGGMPFCVQDRARALARLGHEVDVVTTFKLGVQKIAEDVNGMGALEIYHNHNSPEMVWSREFAEACREHYKMFVPDVLHFDSFDRRYQWWPSSACVTLHGFGWGAFLTRWNMFRAGRGTFPAFDYPDLRAEAMALQTFDRVIGVSRHEHRMLRDEYGLENARLVYNPVAPQFFDRPLPPSDHAGEYFLCAAVSGQKERGFDVAQAACRHAGVRFMEVRNVPREAMLEVYDGARALLLPTFYGQGYDLAVAEARARGVPAIMSSTGSYLAEAEDFDRLVPPGNIEMTIAAINEWRPCARADVRRAAEQHRPVRHAMNWLEAVRG